DRPPARAMTAEYVSRAVFASHLLLLLSADLLVPTRERDYQLVRRERQLLRIVGDGLGVFGAAVLLDHLLALRRRQRERHVLHRRARIEIAIVIGRGLCFLAQHVVEQVD